VLLDQALVVRRLVHELVILGATLVIASPLRVYVNISIGLVGATKLRAIELGLAELCLVFALGRLALLDLNAGHRWRFMIGAHHRSGFVWFGIEGRSKTLLAVLAALMAKEHHRRPFVLEAVSAALSARHPVRRLDRGAAGEGAPGRLDINHLFFMIKAPSSALTRRPEVGLLAAPRPIAQLGVHVHHCCRLVLDAKQSTFLSGVVKPRLRTTTRVRAFRAAYVDHTRLCVGLT
jgi:hypothetical protein